MQVILLDLKVDKEEEPEHTLHWTEDAAKAHAVKRMTEHGWDLTQLGENQDPASQFAAIKEMELQFHIHADLIEMALPGLPIDLESKWVEGDAHIVSEKAEAFEYHWRDAFGDGNTVLVTYCPRNYPALNLWMMSDADSRKSVAKLLGDGTGWEKHARRNDPQELPVGEGEDESDA